VGQDITGTHWDPVARRSGVTVFSVDADGKTNVLGGTLQATFLAGESLLEVLPLHRSSLAKVEEAFAASKRGDMVRGREIIFAIGSQKTEVLLDLTPYRDSTGAVVEVMGVCREAGGSRLSLPELQASAGIDVDASLPIFGVDTNLAVVTWNQMAVEISGQTPEQVSGRPLAEVLVPDTVKDRRTPHKDKIDP